MKNLQQLQMLEAVFFLITGLMSGMEYIVMQIRCVMDADNIGYW